MPWPAAAVDVGDVIQASQLNLLPIRIADTSLAAAASSITFSSLPTQFAHLLLACFLRGDTAAASVFEDLTFNGDTGANYDSQNFESTATTSGSSEAFGITAIQIGSCAAASAPAGIFGPAWIFIPNYQDTSGGQPLLALAGRKTGTASGNLSFYGRAGFWRTTAAITSITLTPSAGNWDIGSRATLYGLA